jgi:Antitoxin VbhA
MATLAAARPIAVSESLLRHEAVENALADLRLEGLTPSSEALLLFERYVNGAVTDQDLVNAILAR